jgi:hypothetical protein
MRRILIFIVILILIGGAVWFFFGRKTDQQPGSPVGNLFNSFFPIGGDTTVPNETIPTPTPGSSAAEELGRLNRITSRPVAGYTAFDRTYTITVPSSDPKQPDRKETVTEHVIRYVSRANGFVYEITERDGTTSPALQISNIYIPNIYEAVFTDNNKTVILRFLRDDNQTIASYSVPIPEPNTDNTRTQKEGTYLPNNVSSLAATPSGTIARLTSEQGSGVVTTTNSVNANKKEVLRTPFHEWLLSWGGQNLYTQTKASANADGFLYMIDQNQKRLVKILGNIPGLTASVSPSGAHVLYSQSTQTGFTTSILNTKTNATRSFNLSILPEKCAWMQNEDLICGGNTSVASSVYPDSWYAGISHFSDRLYRIYTNAGTYDVLSNNEGESLDITNVTISESKGYVYFINKQTGLLWRFRL